MRIYSELGGVEVTVSAYRVYLGAAWLLSPRAGWWELQGVPPADAWQDCLLCRRW